jgi:hypothetical protein
MTLLLKNLKALWLDAVHGEHAGVRFSRGLTIRSHKVRRNARPALRLVKTTGMAD